MSSPLDTALQQFRRREEGIRTGVYSRNWCVLVLAGGAANVGGRQ